MARVASWSGQYSVCGGPVPAGDAQLAEHLVVLVREGVGKLPGEPLERIGGRCILQRFAVAVPGAGDQQLVFVGECAQRFVDAQV